MEQQSGHRPLRLAGRAYWLDVEHVAEAVNAYDFASRVKLPLNAQLTVNWEATPLLGFRPTGGGDWSDLSDAQTNLADDTTRQLDRWAVKAAWVWCRERANGRGRLHTHFVLHLGSDPGRVGEDLKRYLDRKFRFHERGICIDPLKTEIDRTNSVRYTLKGINRSLVRYDRGERVYVADYLRIPDEGWQGEIMIKRAGVSQNIAKAARSRTEGWSEIWDLEKMHSVLNPVEL